MADSLPDISDDFSSNSKTKQSTSSSSVKALSTKKRSQLEKHELQQFKVVQNHKVFAQNPLATLKEHLSSIYKKKKMFFSSFNIKNVFKKNWIILFILILILFIFIFRLDKFKLEQEQREAEELHRQRAAKRHEKANKRLEKIKHKSSN